MLFRATLFCVAGLAAALASAQDQATVTFSGKGKQPIEVRDNSGNVTEVVGQRSLSINQIPGDAAAREKAYRDSQNQRAAEIAAERQAEETAAATAKVAAEAAAKEEADAKAAAEAKAAEEEWDPTPRKVRRKTVRGTRNIGPAPATAPASTPAYQTPSTAPGGLTGPKLESPRQP